MTEMKQYKLGDICTDIAYGYTESASWENIGPKFLRITDIQNYFIDWENVPHCPITQNNHKKYKLDLGDIVIARTGATTGVTSIFKDKEIDAVFASYLIRYKINKDIANPFYIGYILKSTLWKSYVDSIIGGSAQPGANAKQFANFDILLPEKLIQNSIASILTSLDERIELNLKMNQTLEMVAQTIFNEWFVNFNFPGFDGELVDGLPKKWRMGKVADMCKVNASTLNAKDDVNEIHYIEISEVDKGVIKNITIYKRGEEPSRAKRKLSHGDVVLSTVRPNRGSYFLCLFPGTNLIASTGFAVFTATSVPFPFLYCVLTNEEQIAYYGKMADGAAYPAINQSVIMNIDFVIPTKEVLKLFNDVVENLYLKVYENLEQNKTLSQIRDSLLPKLMTGQIEIKE